MAASMQRRVEDLERKLAAMMRERQHGNARTATPLNIRNGWWLGVLNAQLSQGGTASAELLFWSITDSAWIASGTNITVNDFFLNTTKSIPSGTKILFAWYRNAWVVLNWYCAESDTLPEE